MNNSLEAGKKFYRDGAAHALTGYQLIEELLKTYIGNHFEITRSLLAGRMHFGFTRKDYDQAPLERLLTVFSKICSDTALVADLRAEVSHRNHIAHQSMLLLFAKSGLTEQQLKESVASLVERNDCITALLNRLNLAHDDLVSPYLGVMSDDA